MIRSSISVVVRCSIGLLFLFVSCGGNHDAVVDCRDAAHRLSAEYTKDGWLIRENHYRARDHGCYLRIEAVEDGGQSAVEKIIDVNENRTAASCVTKDALDIRASWICTLHYQEEITRERFFQVRKEMMGE